MSSGWPWSASKLSPWSSDQVTNNRTKREVDVKKSNWMLDISISRGTLIYREGMVLSQQKIGSDRSLQASYTKNRSRTDLKIYHFEIGQENKSGGFQIGLDGFHGADSFTCWKTTVLAGSQPAQTVLLRSQAENPCMFFNQLNMRNAMVQSILAFE